MKLLAVDASSENISVCIKCAGKEVTNINRRLKFGASKLVSFIDESLKKTDLELKDFDAFVIGKGPGSFTGLRISFSVIKALMIALNKPVVGIGSFFACAYSLRNSAEKIAVISDARRELFYLSLFKHRAGELVKEGKEKLVELKDILRVEREYLFVTYDSNLRARILKLTPDVKFYSQDVYPKAKYFIKEAEKCYGQGKFIPIEKLKPLYLHPKTCQIRR